MALNWGVIGACGIADRRTIPEGIIKSDKARLVAVMDVAEDNLKKVAEKYGGVKTYTKEEDLIADGNVQAVYVATPTYLHCKQSTAAMKAGKHVLCEKPAAMNVEEAGRMLETAKKNGVKLSFGYMMRYHAYNKKIKEMVDGGLLGIPVSGRAQLTCWYPKIEGAWRQDPELGRGGSLIDMASHCMDLLEMFFGKASEISAFTGNLVQDYSSEDTAAILMKFKSGAVGFVDAHFNIPDDASKNILEVYGSKGSLRAFGTIGQIPTGELYALIEKEEKGYAAQQERAGIEEEKIEVEPVNIYKAEIEAFTDAVEKDTVPPITPEDGLWNLKLCLAAYESAKTGRVVRL